MPDSGSSFTVLALHKPSFPPMPTHPQTFGSQRGPRVHGLECGGLRDRFERPKTFSGARSETSSRNEIVQS